MCSEGWNVQEIGSGKEWRRRVEEKRGKRNETGNGEIGDIIVGGRGWGWDKE